MSTDRTTSLEVAARFFAATDPDATRACYAPEARIWHNVDGKEQTVDESLRLSSWVRKNITGYRYDDVRLQATDEGFIQQHVIRGVSRSGAELAIPACIVARVAGGRIIRIDEYLDSAATKVLFA